MTKGENNDANNESGHSMKNDLGFLNSVQDPKTLAFDISNENDYLKKLLLRLFELEQNSPNKNYSTIFYERYIEHLGSEKICELHKISQNELNDRLLDIVKCVNKEN